MARCRHCGCETSLPPVFGQCPLCNRYMGGPCACGCLWFILLCAALAFFGMHH